MDKRSQVPRTSGRPAARPLIQLSGAALAHVRGGGDEDPDTTHQASKPASKLH